jgi:hypothetical protein
MAKATGLVITRQKLLTARNGKHAAKEMFQPTNKTVGA